MKSPAVPENEAERLADLYDYGILDTPSEKIFDEVAQLAATICGTSFAAITLVDRDRQWFKSEFGLNLKETSRRESICGHAILGRELFEVHDTQRDERFVDNPLLRGAPGIRFYGGSQLVSDRGNAIGMLCVMDSQPHELTAEQRKALTQLASMVMAIIEAGRKTRLASWFGTLLDNVQDEILILDPDTLVYLYANRAARDNLGYTLEEIRTRTPMDVTRDFNPEKFHGFVARLRSGEPFTTFEGARCRSNAQTYPVEARWQLLTTRGRTVVLSIVQDVTERRAAERMKDDFITRLSRELDLARTMQRGLLPPPGQVLDVKIGWFFEASSFVGGDSFEYMAIDDHHLCFFMLDVAGHGVSAAMMALSAQHQLYEIARRLGGALLAGRTPLQDVAVRVMNEYNDRTVALKDAELYVTMLLGIYDARSRRAAVVQAGYPPLLVSRGGEPAFRAIGAGGVPVGILAEPGYVADVVELPPGSRIVAHSDGVVECINPRTAEYGSERLASFLASTRDRPVEAVARAMQEQLVDWRAGAGFEDDVSFVMMEFV